MYYADIIHFPYDLNKITEVSDLYATRNITISITMCTWIVLFKFITAKSFVHVKLRVNSALSGSTSYNRG